MTLIMVTNSGRLWKKAECLWRVKKITHKAKQTFWEKCKGERERRRERERKKKMFNEMWKYLWRVSGGHKRPQFHKLMIKSRSPRFGSHLIKTFRCLAVVPLDRHGNGLKLRREMPPGAPELIRARALRLTACSFNHHSSHASRPSLPPS